MLQNYLKIAYRHLLRNKIFSLINVMGLAVGFTSFFFITQYINFELSFDQFHTNKDEIFRVALERNMDADNKHSSTNNFAGLRKLLRENFPDVHAVTGFYRTPANTGVLFKYQGKIFNELGGELNADSSFFKVFPSLLIRGDAATVLHDPHSIVLSESMAKKIFGDAEPMGQRLQRPDDGGGEMDCVVTGILRDIPQNAHFHANFVVPLEYEWIQDEWKQDFLLTYITLEKGSDPEKVSDRLNQIYRKLENRYPEVKGTRCILQPLQSIHLSSELTEEMETNGNKLFVYIASFIGLIILLIAWINYINLETAGFIARAREVGVRRIIGSRKTDLAARFLVEYLYISTAAGILSVLIVFCAFPYFTYLTGIPIGHIQWPQTEILIVALSILFVGSTFVGVYPAIFLLRLNPVLIIKGNYRGAKGGSFLRRSLIIAQFCISLILIAFVLVIDSQLDFMRVANKKFDVEQVVSIRNPTAYSNEAVIDKHNAYKILENRLFENPAVKMVTSSSAIPGTEIGFTYINLLKRSVNDPYDPTPYKTLFVDYNYIPFFGLKLLAGRNFDLPRPVSDWRNPWEDENWLTLILNESAIRVLGFNSPEEAVGQVVEFKNFEDHFQKHKIIGVIADYHHEAVKKEVLPTILSPNYGSFQQVYYSIRLHAGSDTQNAIAVIEDSWKQAFPEKPFEYFFLDVYYDQQFKSEIYFNRIFVIFAGIAIFIASLGILGMTLFEANARVREISIRKVLGASISSLFALLSKDHVRIIFLSVLISVPLIWVLASEWLSNYPSRIGVSVEFFLVPVLLVVVMVILTSSFQTWKAAQSNPIDHLRNE